jgi:quinol monooxygenase YgiN
MIVRPRHSRQTIETLRSIMSAAQTERGFIAGRIYQEVDNCDSLCLEQDWYSEQALRSHIRSSYFTDLLMLMETAPVEPVFEVHSVSDVLGLNYVETVRFSDY